ncbi:DoxX family membrane protein [Rhizomonospora bruguierae]|uniref:DoxX family membrane protein n=1 Tax=Rhizomonospora bruguierae TaxID=1581705 RepID=UPI001BD037AC|nr:DoxX family membrane protein [Micromonospora sp. NBRC 107566]
MTIQNSTSESSTRTLTTPLERAEVPGAMLTKAAAKTLAVLRIATGFVFLWAFLDKLFGLGYSTPSARAWINGGSPTKGFLSSVEVGPFQSAAHAIAGTWWANVLFMLGLAAIGLALISGIGLRVAAGSATLMMGMMWLAEFPLAQHTSAGAPTGSTNPLTDYHLVYAIVAIVLAAAYAGHTWGLGRRWAKLPFVQKHRWLI